MVLGIIPLIISALEHYSGGVQATLRRFGYRWEINRYSVTMRIEGSIFRNASTWLLTRIAGPLEIDLWKILTATHGRMKDSVES